MTLIEYTDLIFGLFALFCLILLFLLIIIVGMYGLTLVLGGVYFDLTRFFDNKGKWK